MSFCFLMLETKQNILYNIDETGIGDDIVYELKNTIKLINKKYFLNEFLNIRKIHQNSYEVLVIDNLNKRVYMEENYPKNLVEDSKIKVYAKKEFLEELNAETKELLELNFPEIYNEYFFYDEQKSLF